MDILIVGSGVVGYATGKGLSNLGNDVTFYDIDPERLDYLENQGLKTIDKIEGQYDVSYICVPTDTNEEQDLSAVISETKNLKNLIEQNDQYHVVTIKSTVLPGTTENVVKPILDKSQKDYGLCMNPEFLTEIEDSWTEDSSYQRDFFSEDRIVIGEIDKRSGDVLESLYKPLDTPIIRTDPKTAETIKYSSNVYLAGKISLGNELHMICEEMGVDPEVVMDSLSLDPRIGDYGTVTGKAFGGKCLPKALKPFLDSQRLL